MYKIWYIDYYVLPLQCLSKTEQKKATTKGMALTTLSYIFSTAKLTHPFLFSK